MKYLHLIKNNDCYWQKVIIIVLQVTHYFPSLHFICVDLTRQLKIRVFDTRNPEVRVWLHNSPFTKQLWWQWLCSTEYIWVPVNLTWSSIHAMQQTNIRHMSHDQILTWGSLVDRSIPLAMRKKRNHFHTAKFPTPKRLSWQWVLRGRSIKTLWAVRTRRRRKPRVRPRFARRAVVKDSLWPRSWLIR